MKQSKFRTQEQLFLLEGLRLCEEAFRSELQITDCIVEKGFNKIPLPPHVVVHEANKTQLGQIADSRHPQGIIAIASIPVFQPLSQPEAGELVLALDRIADPGNLGTIFRSALWFGVNHVVLGPGCVDPFSPKAVRGSMGAIGHLKLHLSESLVEDCKNWKQDGGTLAALHMVGNPLDQVSRSSGLMIIVGSEAHGVHPDLLAMSDAITIPKTGLGESLNAAMATSIALYELQKKNGVD